MFYILLMPAVFSTEQDLNLFLSSSGICYRSGPAGIRSKRTRLDMDWSQASPGSLGSKCQPVGSGDRKLTKVHIDFQATCFVSLCLRMQDQGRFYCIPFSVLGVLHWKDHWCPCCSCWCYGINPKFCGRERTPGSQAKGSAWWGNPLHPRLLSTPGDKALGKSLRGQSKGINKVMVTSESNPEERDCGSLEANQ